MIKLFEHSWEGKYNYYTINADLSFTDWAIPIRISWFKSDPIVDEDSYIPISMTTIHILCLRITFTKTWEYEEGD